MAREDDRGAQVRRARRVDRLLHLADDRHQRGAHAAARVPPAKAPEERDARAARAPARTAAWAHRRRPHACPREGSRAEAEAEDDSTRPLEPADAPPSRDRPQSCPRPLEDLPALRRRHEDGRTLPMHHHQRDPCQGNRRRAARRARRLSEGRHDRLGPSSGNARAGRATESRSRPPRSGEVSPPPSISSRRSRVRSRRGHAGPASSRPTRPGSRSSIRRRRRASDSARSGAGPTRAGSPSTTR